MTLKKFESLVLFLVIFLIPTQLGRHFWPEFSFVYSIPIDYLSPTLYFWDICVVFLIACLIISGRHINRVALNLFYFFILTQALSLFSNTANIGIGLVRLEQYVVAGLFGVYIASEKVQWFKKAFLWGFSLAVFFESFLATLQFLKMGTIGFWILGERSFSLSTPGIAKFDYYGREFLRPYATFPHPNLMAAFMIISILLLNTLLYESFVGVKFKRIKFILTFLSSVSILLSASRVVIVSLIVFLCFAAKKKGRLLLVLIFLILLPVLYTRFSSLMNYDNLAFLRREELAIVSLKVWKNSPLIGVGLNNFIPAASDLLLSGPSRFLQPVHNIFLLSLSETGLLGLIGLISLIGYPIFKISKLSPKPYPLNPMLFVWGIVIFLGMFDHYFLTLPQGYRLLFLVWGLTLSVLE